MAPRWVVREALLALHEESLVQFGGARGVRDAGLLDSALARPENKHFYEPEANILLLAAAYGFGIARNHPFVDGNKRAALLAILVFLRRNGYRLVADASELEQAILDLVTGFMDEEGMAAWLKGHTGEEASGGEDWLI